MHTDAKGLGCNQQIGYTSFFRHPIVLWKPFAHGDLERSTYAQMTTTEPYEPERR